MITNAGVISDHFFLHHFLWVSFWYEYDIVWVFVPLRWSMVEMVNPLALPRTNRDC